MLWFYKPPGRPSYVTVTHLLQLRPTLIDASILPAQWENSGTELIAWLHLRQETQNADYLGVLRITRRINKWILVPRPSSPCWVTGTNSQGSLKSMIFYTLGWKRPWFYQRGRDMAVAKTGKKKSGGCRDYDLWSLISQNLLTGSKWGDGENAGDGIWERCVQKSWCQAKIPEG